MLLSTIYIDNRWYVMYFNFLPLPYYYGQEEVFGIVSLPFQATQQCPVVAMVTQQCINSIKNSFCTLLTRNQLKSNTCLLTHWQSHNTPAPDEWMAKYKNGVADIEIPTIRTWNSASQINKVYRKVWSWSGMSYVIFACRMIKKFCW